MGARASSGEGELKDRGYHHRKTIKVKDKSIMTRPEAVCDCKNVDSDRHHGDGQHGTNDLVGMRASSGERELEDRGYKFVNSTKGSGRIWSNWWNRSKRKCITVVTMDGRYDSVTDTLPADCSGKMERTITRATATMIGPRVKTRLPGMATRLNSPTW